MMIKCNIPLNDIESKELVSFLNDCFKFKLLSRTAYRTNYLTKYYYEQLQLKTETIKGCKIYIQIDETPDKIGRKILNIFIGKLNKVFIHLRLFWKRSSWKFVMLNHFRNC